MKPNTYFLLSNNKLYRAYIKAHIKAIKNINIRFVANNYIIATIKSN